MADEHNSNSSLLMTTSSSSSSDEVEPTRKRYKQFLYKNSNENQACKRTEQKYNSICKTQNQSTLFPNQSSENSHILQLDENQDKSVPDQDIYGNPTSENNVDMNLEMQSCNVTSGRKEADVQHEDEMSQDCHSFEILSDRDFNFKGTDNTTDSESVSSSLNNSFGSSDSMNYSDTENERSTYFDKIMFDTLKLTVRDIILMCTAFALHFNISDQALLMLVSMFQFCAGPEFSSLNLSKHMMAKCFSSQNENVTYHYYCNICLKRIIFSKKENKPTKKLKRICGNCKKQACITSASENYFLTIDLAYQIKILFSNQEIVDDIFKNITSNNNEFKGSIHKNILAESDQNNKKDEYILTFNCNTDGAPLTKSGKKSFWPLQLCLNELSSKFQSQFIILAGLLMVTNEPNSKLMNLYLSKFVEQINSLYKDGISLTHNGTEYIMKFCTLSFPVDTVCRPIVQNRLKFNAYCGCSWCEQLGFYVKAVHGIRYLRNQESILRLHENHLQYIKDADDMKTPRIGVKGYSAILKLPHMDIVWSFPFEYMHGLLLGVVWQLMNLWKKPGCEYRIKKKDLNAMEKRYLKITPIHEIHRLPRAGIIKGSMKPKASELKSWLLYFGLPCLQGFLHEKALRHFALLVRCAFTILKSDISNLELNQCEEDFILFVLQFQDLYGEGAMTFNVHALMHCAESVRKTGPLSKNSAFPYESFIYTLKKFISGPKGMDKQIARKHLQSIIFKCNSKEMLNASENTANYCFNMFTPRRMSKFYKEIKDVTFCGKGIFERHEQVGECFAYNECIYKGVIYHSAKYVQGKKTDDSYIQLRNDQFFRILKIFHCDNNCILKLISIPVYSNDPFPGVRHIKQFKTEDCNNIIFTDINYVKSKVMVIIIENASYFCTMPNTFEIQ